MVLFSSFFLKREFLHLNQTSIKNFMKSIMEPYKAFFASFDFTKLNFLIATIQLKIEHHQVIREKKEKVVAPIC